jgi:hypothetical protein
VNCIKFYFAAFLLLTATSLPAAAGSPNVFSKSVQQAGTTFDISSRPVAGGAVHIVTVGVRRGGKKIATFKADVDYMPRSAQAVDLTGDGAPELAVISRARGSASAEALDVYWLDGTNLMRSTVPEPDDKKGYKGGRFSLEGRLIVHTIPLYRDGDRIERPTGGTRTTKYEFKEGIFTQYVQTESEPNPPDAAPVAAPPPPPSPPASVPGLKAEETAVSVAAGVIISEVTATEAGIEIRAIGPVEKFKTMKLEKPERIAIDIPGADSYLVGKKVAINRFGISKARIGRNKGFLRIVLDTTLGAFPKYEVKSSRNGVLVEFTK